MDDVTIQKQYGPWALVAGASEGLGAAFAKEAGAKGLNVVLVARRAEALEGISKEIRETYDVEARSIVADLSDAESPNQIADACSDITVGMMIHNAAAEPQGLFLDVPVDEHIRAIDVNCRSTISLAHHFGGLMAERGRGSLVIITSLGGLCGLPVFSSYGATKAFDWNLGECLWDELRLKGVDALAYVVGSTRTPNLERSGAPEEHLRQAVSPRKVAARLFGLLDQGPTQYGQEEVEAAAKHMFGLSRSDAVVMLGESSRDNFLGKTNDLSAIS